MWWLSWLPVSFLLHVKYTLSYRIVLLIFRHQHHSTQHHQSLRCESLDVWSRIERKTVWVKLSHPVTEIDCKMYLVCRLKIEICSQLIHLARYAVLSAILLTCCIDLIDACIKHLFGASFYFACHSITSCSARDWLETIRPNDTDSNGLKHNTGKMYCEWFMHCLLSTTFITRFRLLWGQVLFWGAHAWVCARLSLSVSQNSTVYFKQRPKCPSAVPLLPHYICDLERSKLKVKDAKMARSFLAVTPP